MGKKAKYWSSRARKKQRRCVANSTQLLAVPCTERSSVRTNPLYSNRGVEKHNLPNTKRKKLADNQLFFILKYVNYFMP